MTVRGASDDGVGPLHVDGVDALVDVIESRSAGVPRFVVGLVGPPGVGKSTVSAALRKQLQTAPPIVGLDAFHLANEVLLEHGAISRKGAPDTFDAHGFIALLERLRSTTETVWCPRFDRSIEDSIAAAVAVRPEDRLVIVEGNYLLLDTAPWHRAVELLDLIVYLDLDQATRLRRLIARHVEFGKSPAEAERFVATSDEANARLVAASRSRAGVIVTIS